MSKLSDLKEQYQKLGDEIKELKEYPCDECGKLRTKDEGGTTFTVCDECWDKCHKSDSIYKCTLSE